MNTQRRNLLSVGLVFFGLLAICTVAAGQEPPLEKRTRRGTVQSELDYLRAAKLPISIELTQVTIRQAYDGIAKQAGLSVTYEGAVPAGSKHDVSFKTTTLKDALDELGRTFKLAYRVDGPDKLTVVGAISKSS